MRFKHLLTYCLRGGERHSPPAARVTSGALVGGGVGVQYPPQTMGNSSPSEFISESLLLIPSSEKRQAD